MKIKNIKNLLLRDVFLYDIVSCHYSILKKYNFDVSFIKDQNNKLERNIQIGKLMGQNENIKTFLRNTTKNVLDKFIYENGIKNEDIILRQYDGIMSHKYINLEDSNDIQPKLRSQFEYMLISYDLNSYIAKDIINNKIIIKGVPHLYDYIEEYYEKILNINFACKSSIFKTLEKLKNEFYLSENSKNFGIPMNDDKYIIYLKEYGEYSVTKQTMNIIDPDEIDKKKYFNLFIKPFNKSIMKEFL